MQCNKTYNVSSNKEEVNVKEKHSQLNKTYDTDIQCNKTYNVSSNKEELNVKEKHSQLNKTYVTDNNRKENEFKVDQLAKINKTYIVSNEKEIVDLKKISNNETDKSVTLESPLNTASEEDKQSHNTPSEKCNFDNQPHEINQFHNVSLNHTKSSSNDSDEAETCDAENITNLTSNTTRFQKFSRWWKTQKRSFCRITNACIPCGGSRRLTQF